MYHTDDSNDTLILTFHRIFGIECTERKLSKENGDEMYSKQALYRAFDLVDRIFLLMIYRYDE